MAITIKEWKILSDHTEKGLEPPRSPSAAASSAPAVQRVRPKIGKQLLIVRRSLHEKGFGVLDLSLSSFCASRRWEVCPVPGSLARLSAPLLCRRRSRGPRELIVGFFRI